MKRYCDNCGCEADDYWMHSFNPGGTGVQWWCSKCWNNSQHQASASDHHRHKQLYKIQNSKKRHK